MLDEIKARRLAGIYCVNWKIPAQRAIKHGKTWWTVIPRDEDAVLMLDPASLSSGPPLIAFRRELDHRREQGCGLLKNEQPIPPSPARLDAALLKAWTSYKLWQTNQLAPCSESIPGLITTLASFESTQLEDLRVRNVVPEGYCRVSSQTNQPIPTVPAGPMLPEIIPVQFPVPTQETVTLRLISRWVGNPSKKKAIQCKYTVKDARGNVQQRESGGTFSAKVMVPVGRVTITVRPADKNLWDFEGVIVFGKDGTFSRPTSESAHLRVASAQPREFQITAFPSRLKLARKLDPTLEESIPAASAIHFVQREPLVNGKIRLEKAKSAPKTEEEVFEVKTAGFPKLIAVSWPLAFEPTSAKPVPFLVFYSPHEILPASSDPIIPQHVIFGFTKFLRYEGGKTPVDPLETKERMGLPYQIEHSGRNLALVLPLPSGCPKLKPAEPCKKPGNSVDHGKFKEPTFVLSVLRDIQAYMLRRLAHRASRPFFPRPPVDIGDVALAGWSEGNTAVMQLMQDQKASELMREKVREVYGFGPGMGSSDWLKHANAWRTGTKKIRLYHDVRGMPKVRKYSVNEPNRTVLLLGQQAWDDVERDKGIFNGRTAHGATAAFMLTDALRRSSF